MDPNMVIPVLVGLVSGAITPIVIELLRRKSKMQSEAETDVDVAEAAQKIVSGSASAVDVMTDLLKRYDLKIEEQEREIRNLQAQITKMQLDERARERYENVRNKAIADKIEGLENYIKTLIDTLRTNNLEIPPRPEILKNRDTLDKIRAIQFPIKPGETL